MAPLLNKNVFNFSGRNCQALSVHNEHCWTQILNVCFRTPNSHLSSGSLYTFTLHSALSFQIIVYKYQVQYMCVCVRVCVCVRARTSDVMCAAAAVRKVTEILKMYKLYSLPLSGVTHVLLYSTSLGPM